LLAAAGRDKGFQGAPMAETKRTTAQPNIAEARAALLARLGLEAAPGRFDEALTHSSYANERRGKGVLDNQRLEFLGDAVLDLCVSELLLEKLPGADEGVLSRALGALVSTEHLAVWGRDNGVGPALRLGKGASVTGTDARSNVLADAVEALVAAVYLDGGLAQARRVCSLIVINAIDHATDLARRDPKSALQEALQVGGGAGPTYRVLRVDGPPHDRLFIVGVEIAGQIVAEGQGRSKQIAEQEAAARALVHL
jgi:ribonuclease-3